jgi:biotin carboxyl carrier protein
MQYYVSLNDQEFPLALVESSAGAKRHAHVAAGTLEIEVLSQSAHGRPALVLVDGVVCRVLVGAGGRGGGGQRALINGHALTLRVESELERRARPNRNTPTRSASQVHAPMPGRVVKVNVRVGDVVSAGTPLLGIEAMKMENELLAPGPGTVARVHVSVGSTVEADQELIVLDPS